jgi:hypothetical protein
MIFNEYEINKIKYLLKNNPGIQLKSGVIEFKIALKIDVGMVKTTFLQSSEL